MLTLEKAHRDDCPEIHKMQVLAFGALLDKYQDTATNPGAEPVERIALRMAQDTTDYYFITRENRHIGAIRIVHMGQAIMRISPMFILPEFQGRGYAGQVLRMAEGMYPDTYKWTLDTIKQEEKLCHLYEKMGYTKTGQEEEIKDGMTIVYYHKIMKHS